MPGSSRTKRNNNTPKEEKARNKFRTEINEIEASKNNKTPQKVNEELILLL